MMIVQIFRQASSHTHKRVTHTHTPFTPSVKSQGEQESLLKERIRQAEEDGTAGKVSSMLDHECDD